MTQPKVKRLHIRTTAIQDERLRSAAEAQDVPVSDFVLGSAMSKAEKVLADRRWFELSEEDFAQFEEALEMPVDGSKLARLLASDSVFGKEFHLD